MKIMLSVSLSNRQLPAGHVCPISNIQISFHEPIFELSLDISFTLVAMFSCKPTTNTSALVASMRVGAFCSVFARISDSTFVYVYKRKDWFTCIENSACKSQFLNFRLTGKKKKHIYTLSIQVNWMKRLFPTFIAKLPLKVRSALTTWSISVWPASGTILARV